MKNHSNSLLMGTNLNKCHNCGNTADFTQSQRGLICDYCDSLQAVKQNNSPSGSNQQSPTPILNDSSPFFNAFAGVRNAFVSHKHDDNVHVLQGVGNTGISPNILQAFSGKCTKAGLAAAMSQPFFASDPAWISHQNQFGAPAQLRIYAISDTSISDNGKSGTALVEGGLVSVGNFCDSFLSWDQISKEIRGGGLAKSHGILNSMVRIGSLKQSGFFGVDIDFYCHNKQLSNDIAQALNKAFI